MIIHWRRILESHNGHIEVVPPPPGNIKSQDQVLLSDKRFRVVKMDFNKN
jgi:hypothetical protein